MDFLRDYRSTPNCATGRTPAELMIGRQVRTPLSLLQPSVHHDNMPPLHSTAFAIGDHVFVRSYGVNRKVKWLPGRMTSSLGTRMFTVQCTDDIHRRHIDQMRHRVKTSPAPVPPPVEELRLPTYVRAASPPRSPIRETTTRDVSPRLLKTSESFLHLETWLLHQCFVGVPAIGVPVLVTPRSDLFLAEQL